MQIHRIRGRDLREALERARAQHGDDADHHARGDEEADRQDDRRVDHEGRGLAGDGQLAAGGLGEAAGRAGEVAGPFGAAVDGDGDVIETADGAAGVGEVGARGDQFAHALDAGAGAGLYGGGGDLEGLDQRQLERAQDALERQARAASCERGDVEEYRALVARRDTRRSETGPSKRIPEAASASRCGVRMSFAP